MNDKLGAISAAIVAAVFVSGGLLLAWPPKTTTIVQQAPSNGYNVGSVASPDIQSPYFSVGGARQWKQHAGLTAGSQTLCSIQAPAATTSRARFNVTIGNNLAVTDLIQVGWSTTQGATTTLITSRALLSAGSITLEGTTTDSTVMGSLAVEPGVVQPNTWFSVRIASGTPTTFAPTGGCNLQLDEAL